MTADPNGHGGRGDRSGRSDPHDLPGGSGAPASLGPFGLLAWTLGTFHACAVGLTLLLLVYPLGGLGPALGALDTVTGLLIFIALWATSVWTARRVLAGGDWLSAVPARRWAFFRRAIRWGGATGMLFLAELGAILLVRTLIVSPRDILANPLAVVGAAVFVGSFGTIVAFLFGGLIGSALAALDLDALALARRVPRTRRPPG